MDKLIMKVIVEKQKDNIDLCFFLEFVTMMTSK